MTTEEAIDFVLTAFDMWEIEYDCGDDWSDVHEARDMAVKALEELNDLPSVQPERGKGKIEMRSTGYYGYAACDQCGISVHPDDKFCRDCGVKFER